MIDKPCLVAIRLPGWNMLKIKFTITDKLKRTNWFKAHEPYKFGAA